MRSFLEGHEGTENAITRPVAPPFPAVQQRRSHVALFLNSPTRVLVRKCGIAHDLMGFGGEAADPRHAAGRRSTKSAPETLLGASGQLARSLTKQKQVWPRATLVVRWVPDGASAI